MNVKIQRQVFDDMERAVLEHANQDIHRAIHRSVSWILSPLAQCKYN